MLAFSKKRCIINFMGILTIEKKSFGVFSDGSEASLYTVSNGVMSFSASDYGCTLTSINLPDSKKAGGKTVDVLLGFSTLEGWVQDSSCFGTCVGRFANRIGKCSFTLDGKEYKLDDNDFGRTLHGGFDRWEKMLWNSRIVSTENGLGVEFSRTSPDGEQNFPGNVDVTQTYTLDSDNNLTIEYNAVTDKATPLNITNHAYFNLKGYDGGSVFDQELYFDSDSVLEIGEDHIPTGKKISVKGTPFDFTSPKLIGKDFEKVAPGYDHFFCVNGYKNDGTLREFCYVKDPASGRKMTVKTTQPGIQLYTANFIDGIKGKKGFGYKNQGALCLEAQGYPDAPNKPDFPSAVLRPGEKYHQVTKYCFEF